MESNRTDAFVVDWMMAAHEFAVLVALRAGENETITIENVWAWPADKRRRAQETDALTMLCQLADLHRVTLLGQVESYDKQLEEAIRLRLWFAHHGFEPSIKKGFDLQVSRPPKKPGIAAVNA